MSGSAGNADRMQELVALSLGERRAVEAAVRARADQVLARLGDAMRSGRTPRERIDALIETYLQGAFRMLADAAGSDRFAFAEAEMTAASVAAAMDRAAEAADADDPETVAAAMAAAESLLDLDLATLYDFLR